MRGALLAKIRQAALQESLDPRSAWTRRAVAAGLLVGLSMAVAGCKPVRWPWSGTEICEYIAEPWGYDRTARGTGSPPSQPAGE